ncbi:MAG TPA: hypothetical protein VFI96_06350, partial [Longimicrobiaceae bacterium]|nr:hypothetical protein [Longimicrobiaceae bacterium]
DSTGGRLNASAPIQIQGTSSTYRGDLRVVTVNGVASFDDLAVVKPTTSAMYVIADAYTPGGRRSVATSAFQVVAGPPALIRFRRNDPNLAAIVGPQSANQALQGPATVSDRRLVVEVTDSVGNPVPHSGTVKVIPGPGSPDTVVYGTPTLNLQSSGAQFATDLRLHKNGVYTLVPTMDGLEGVPTDTFSIIGGTASLAPTGGPKLTRASGPATGGSDGKAVRSAARPPAIRGRD